MGHSQAEKVRNRERILKAAAAQIREGGLESVSVGGLMKSVNLTHGGFYGHFESRSELIAEALERALSEGEARAQAGAAATEPSKGLAAFARSYLSRAHRDSPAQGCAIAALVSDVGRADERSRAVMAEHVEAYIAGVRRRMGDADEDAAIAAVCTLVGALALSRVMPDPRRSDAILRAARRRVASLGEADGD